MMKTILVLALLVISCATDGYESGNADQPLRVDPGAVNGSRMKAGPIDVSKAAVAVTGTMGVGNGGTGQSTFSDGFIKSTSDVLAGQAQIQTADIANGAVDTDQLADASVTAAKLSTSINTTLSASSGAFVRNGSAGNGYIDVTGLSAAITTNGRPVLIVLEGDSSTLTSIGVNVVGGFTQNCTYQFLRGATPLGESTFFMDVNDRTAHGTGGFRHEDHGASADPHTYKMQVKCSGGAIDFGQIVITNIRLRVRELN